MLSKIKIKNNFFNFNELKVGSLYFNNYLPKILFNIYIHIYHTVCFNFFLDLGEKLWERSIIIDGKFLNVK